jgi:hypothetical protein
MPITNHPSLVAPFVLAILERSPQDTYSIEILIPSDPPDVWLRVSRIKYPFSTDEIQAHIDRFNRTYDYHPGVNPYATGDAQ